MHLAVCLLEKTKYLTSEELIENRPTFSGTGGGGGGGGGATCTTRGGVRLTCNKQHDF